MSLVVESIDFTDLKSKNSEEFSFFTKEELSLLDPSSIPKHVAIIPDGNRRWSKREVSSSKNGHQEGADIVMDIVKSGKEIGIKTLTFYTFSTENWQRDPFEVQGIFWVLDSYLNTHLKEMIDSGVKFNTIGDLSKLPQGLYDTILETKTLTKDCDQIEMVLAINYGGRDELTRAVRAIALDCVNGMIEKEDITPKLISSYLDTKSWDDPDLVIRTSGEFRISNFLLWQMSYSEIYVSDVLWPDYKPRDLFEAVYKYQQRERRLGRS